MAMLLFIGIILAAFWVLGLFVWHIGTIIYLALIAAVVAFVWHWATHRKHAKSPT